jgi:hypothetical protein
MIVRHRYTDGIQMVRSIFAIMLLTNTWIEDTGTMLLLYMIALT